jgi:hypothetical protein
VKLFVYTRVNEDLKTMESGMNMDMKMICCGILILMTTSVQMGAKANEAQLQVR